MNTRISARLQHISDLLHYYMITPKDAYRKVINMIIFSLIILELDTWTLKSSIKCWRMSMVRRISPCLNFLSLRKPLSRLILEEMEFLISRNSPKHSETANPQAFWWEQYPHKQNWPINKHQTPNKENQSDRLKSPFLNILHNMKSLWSSLAEIANTSNKSYKQKWAKIKDLSPMMLSKELSRM